MIIVDADKSGCPVINIVVSLTKIKVHDVYGVHFFDLGIRLSFGDMLRDDLCRAVEHTLEVVGLTGVLDFYYDQLTFSMLHENVHPVELVVLVSLFPTLSRICCILKSS